MMAMNKDKIIQSLIKKEVKRQNETISLIASENIASKNVLEALGSPFTNKYAEGYPSKRYYGGNVFIDDTERLAKERALKLFGLSADTWRANVQPYSGSPANLAVYFALVPVGEKIMGMRLDMGGHLTHGHKASVTGKLWKQIPYGVDKKTEQLNYEEIKKIAKKEKPKLIITGYSAYPRRIDFKKFKNIANSCGAILLADISHIAGLIAGGLHPSPFPYADVVTTTTHKTLRGPRSAIIFARQKYADDIDKTVFPGLQGGPHINNIAAAAVALHEASLPSFKKYAAQIVENAKMLSEELKKYGFRVVSGGTDNHTVLIDLSPKNIYGKEASDRLETVGIIVNKNAIPYDTRSPLDPSGIRIGTPAVTTRGMKEREMKQIAKLINDSILGARPAAQIKKEVLTLSRQFPIYNDFRSRYTEN